MDMLLPLWLRGRQPNKLALAIHIALRYPEPNLVGGQDA